MVICGFCVAHLVAGNCVVSGWRRRGEVDLQCRWAATSQFVVGVALGGRWDQNFVDVVLVRASWEMNLVAVSAFF